MSENEMADNVDFSQNPRKSYRSRGSYDGGAISGGSVIDGQQSTNRPLSYPSGVGNDESNTPHSKIRSGRKTRHFSAGYSATASAMVDHSLDGGEPSKPSAPRQRPRHHRQQYPSHHCKSHQHHRAMIFRNRHKYNDRARSYNRFSKFHGVEGDLLQTEEPEAPTNQQRSNLISGQESLVMEENGNPDRPTPLGAVTVDTDCTYKTFETKKQMSLPVPATVPILLQQAGSASFTSTSLLPLSMLSRRSLSFFSGITTDKRGNVPVGEPVPPSRQSSENAATAIAGMDERAAFHTTFSLLVQLGAEASSRRVHHYGGVGVGTCPNPNATGDIRDSGSGDSSEPSSLRQQQQVQFSDILWIYFQARRYSRQLPCCVENDLAGWLREQDNLIYEQRLQEGIVLDDILLFRVSTWELQSNTESNPNSPKCGEPGRLDIDNGLLLIATGDLNEANSQLIREEKTLDDISAVLARFEHFQTLYKSSKAMEQSLGDNFIETVKNRLNILYGWSNVATDLRRKLFDVAEMLEVRKYKNRKDSLVSSATSDAVSRSNSSDLGSSIGPPRKFSLTSISHSPAVKTGSDGSAFMSTPKTPMSAISFVRTGSPNSNSGNCTISNILIALSDTDYVRSYAERCLKLRGMRKVLCRVAVIYGQTLWRARQILQRRCTMTPLASFWKLGDASDSPASPFLRLYRSTLLECETDLVRCHVEDETYLAMGLPRSFPIYFVLLRVPLDLVYVWLKLRLDQKTSRDPDRLTTNQLIQDARDCLEAATEVKTFYQDYVQAVVDDEESLERLLVNEMSQFESALKEMFELYLRYVHRWMEYQCMAGVGTRGISREQNQTVLKYLEEEWKFAKRIAINVLFGEAEAAQKFCHMNTAILKNMQELLENSLDETLKRHYEDDWKSEYAGVKDHDLELYSSSSLSSEEDEPAAVNGRSNTNAYDEQPTVLVPIGATSPIRKPSSVLEQCRRLKTIINELRNLAHRSMYLARLLRQDLEIAAKFQLVGSMEALLKRLQETGHWLVKTAPRNANFLILCNLKAAKDECVLRFLLNEACGRDDRFNQTFLTRQIVKHENSYILLIKCDDDAQNCLWKGLVKEITVNADSSLALNHMDVDGVYMVMADSNQLRDTAMAFLSFVGKESLKIVDEQCSCHVEVAENMNEMRACATKMRSKLADWLKTVATELKQDNALTEMEETERQTYRDTLIQAYGVAFEYHRELMRLSNMCMEKEMARNLADFALQWCQLITEVCDEGQGCRPRWATDGINYLVQVADPKLTVYLVNGEFEDLKRAMHKCINHIIGTRPPHASKTSSLGGHRISLDPGSSPSSCSSRDPSRVNLNSLSVESKLGARSSPSSTRSSRDDLQSDNLDNDTFSRRIIKLINRMEHQRDDKLRKEYKLIGRCVDRSEVKATVQMPLKRAGFRWQRLQHFVGRGRYGSVHTALNLDTGQLMAVKQMKLVRKQDHQAMQHLMDEITNFSKIQHPNLVRYFGAEVHQDAILIFMEYCNEGTLASACRDPMSEELVRFYTLSLLHAVGELHRHNIVHRDIKPANIFLANEHRSLKLGDFGSSVRLAGDETAVGELTGYVGTPSYMAPEVCTCARNGYGRGADIWSLGCVVLEMMTGKPPWHDLPEQMAIVWRVGTGGIPDIPPSVGSACLEFLQHCLQSKPADRCGVDRLLELPFVKVKM